MISETMPLNEWPVMLLKNLQLDLERLLSIQMEESGSYSLSTLMVLNAVNQAIKDAEIEESKLPFE